MGEDTCARAKVSAQARGAQLARVLVAPHFFSELMPSVLCFSAPRYPLFSLRSTPPRPFNASNLRYVILIAELRTEVRRALLPEVPLAHLPTLVDAQRPQCGARQSAARLNLLDDVHPLDHVAEDHVLSVEVVCSLPGGSKSSGIGGFQAADANGGSDGALIGQFPWESAPVR